MGRKQVRCLHSIPVFRPEPCIPAPRFPQLQQAAIDHYAADPGLEGSFASKVFQPAEGERVSHLHRVLRVFGVAHNTTREMKGAWVVAADQFGDCTLVALLTPVDQYGFGGYLHGKVKAIGSPND